jgi:hypothetical protein
MSTKKTHKWINPLTRLNKLKRAGMSLLKKSDLIDSDDTDSGSSSGSGEGSGSTRRWPGSGGKDSYLIEETKNMELQRRQMEIEAERKLARVNERDHSQDEQSAPEGDLQNDIKNHPWLDSQRFDGVDPNVSPVPPLNSEARREFDNALRLQNQLRNEKRMENTPKPSSAPKPQMG